MKVLILALLVAVAAAAAFPGDWPGFPRKRSVEKRDTQANANDYADAVLNQVAVFMKANGYDPMPLTDKYAYDFPITDLLGITWNTRLGLYDGTVSYLTTIHRSDDATVTWASDLRSLTLDVGVMFDKLDLGYHWAAQVMSLGPNGQFIAKIKNLKAKMNISVNLLKLNATLNDFTLGEAKSIKVDVKGLTLLGNWAVEAFVNTFLAILKGPILKVVEGKVRDAMVSGVNGVAVSQYFPASQ